MVVSRASPETRSGSMGREESCSTLGILNPDASKSIPAVPAYSHDCAVQKKREICKYLHPGLLQQGGALSLLPRDVPLQVVHPHKRILQERGPVQKFSRAPLTPDNKELLIAVRYPVCTDG